MGSPVSPIVANPCMEAFEHRAITTVVSPPRFWKRFVDDTFDFQQQTHRGVLEAHQFSGSIHPLHCRRDQI